MGPESVEGNNALEHYHFRLGRHLDGLDLHQLVPHPEHARRALQGKTASVCSQLPSRTGEDCAKTAEEVGEEWTHFHHHKCRSWMGGVDIDAVHAEGAPRNH